MAQGICIFNHVYHTVLVVYVMLTTKYPQRLVTNGLRDPNSRSFFKRTLIRENMNFHTKLNSRGSHVIKRVEREKERREM